MQKKRTEGGQVMILLILALVGLFAFAALAIDGGMIYSDRRIAQNAADSSALTGAGAAGQEVQWIVEDSWNCSGADIVNARAIAVAAAIDSVGVNDFTIDADISDNHGVTIHCSDSDDKYLDVEVIITDQTESSFAHLFFNRPLVNTVDAIARIHPRFPVAEGYNIISLTDQCQGNQKGTVIGGTQDMTLNVDDGGEGGGIYSNSCLILNGSSGTITAATLIYNTIDGSYTNNGGMTLNPPDIVSGTPDKLQPVIDIEGACDELAAGTETNVNMGGGVNDITYSSGSYNSINVTDSKDMVHLLPGLYCVSGRVSVSGKLFEGTGVTIALTGNQGFTTNGSSLVKLSAAPANCAQNNKCQGAIGGLLIWADPSNTSDIIMTGTSDSYFDGTVYGKNNQIQIGGNAGVGSINYGAQLIGDTVKVSGNTNINITYNEAYFFHTRAKLEVAK